MSKRRSPEHWRSILKTFECSNQTQTAFCSENDLSISSLQYQLRRRRSDSGDPELDAPFSPQLLEVTPVDSRSNLPAASDPAHPSRSLRVGLSLESRALTIDCHPDQFGALLDGFSTYHDRREETRR